MEFRSKDARDIASGKLKEEDLFCDPEKFKRAAEAWKNICSQRQILNECFPRRTFPLDGKLVGDMGEVIAAIKWDLILLHDNFLSVDAMKWKGNLAKTVFVQIKTSIQKENCSNWRISFSNRQVADSDCPPHLIVLVLRSDSTFRVIYDGPGDIMISPSSETLKRSMNVTTLINYYDRVEETAALGGIKHDPHEWINLL